MNDKLIMENYLLLLKSTVEVFGEIKDYEESLYVAMNGKIRWLNYLLSNLNKGNDVIQTMNSVLLFYRNIPEFKKIYEQIKN